MDDDSRDGSAELVAARPEKWVQIVVRTSERGLSPSVLDGMKRAQGDVLVCMDADLSHPPEAIPHMLRKLEEGADFVIGSRYVEGGSTSDDWGFLRWLNSRVATLLARPLTNARDPMAGFFAFRRSTFLGGARLQSRRLQDRARIHRQVRAASAWSRCPSTSRTASSARAS